MDSIGDRLATDAAEVTEALEMFLTERNAVFNQTERAMDVFQNEMDTIDGTSGTSLEDNKLVDHNMMRYLNMNNSGGDFEVKVSDEFRPGLNTNTDSQQGKRFTEGYIDQPIDIEFDKGLDGKLPVPTVEEKQNLRDQIFSMLDDFRVEETQLELEYDKLRNDIGSKRAEYLAEGLFTIQKENYTKLKKVLTIYQPQGFGKAWGNDADYLAISNLLKKRLKAMDKEHIEKKKNNRK
jgi:hypothetical protein